FRRNEFGGSLGGPILKNRIFGFFSWDQKISSQPFATQATVETPDFVNFMKTNFPDNLSTQLMTNFPATVNGVVPGSVQTVQDLDPNCGTTAPVAGIPCDLAIREKTNESFAQINNGKQWNARINVNLSKDRFYGNFYPKTPFISGTNT